MLANTLTLTINSVAKVLTRVSEQNQSSTYRLKTADEELTLQFRHSKESGAGLVEPIDRHNMFIEWTVYATSTASEKYYTMSVTARARKTSDPEVLEDLILAGNVLLTAQASAFADGEP